MATEDKQEPEEHAEKPVEADASAADGAEAVDGADAADAAPEAAHPKDPEQVRAREDGVIERLLERFPVAEGAILGTVTHVGRPYVTVTKQAIEGVLEFLKDDPELDFGLLVDITCADFMRLPELAPKRFGLLYILYSSKLDAYVRVRVYVDRDEVEVPSVCSVYPGAGWAEREVYDLYGLIFTGHPDLKRLLLPEYFTGYPLRKDYPLKGRGERDSFPVVTRNES